MTGVTFPLLRDTRVTYRRNEDQDQSAGDDIKAADHLDDTTLPRTCADWP